MTENSRKIAKLFIRFLKDYGVYKKFKIKTKYNDRDFFEYIKSRSHHAVEVCRLPSAFTWSVTSEGDEYWRTMLFMWGYRLVVTNTVRREAVLTSLSIYVNSDIKKNLSRLYRLQPQEEFEQYCKAFQVI